MGLFCLTHKNVFQQKPCGFCPLCLASALLVAERALRETADELDAYYQAEYGGDHSYNVRKLLAAKAGNPARAALFEIEKLTGGGE